MRRPVRTGLVHKDEKPSIAKRAEQQGSRQSVLDLPRPGADGSLRADRLSRSNVIALQRTVGNQAVGQLLRANGSAVGTRPRPNPRQSARSSITSEHTPETVRRDPESEAQEWRTAQHVYMNMPIDAGHITGKVANMALVRPIMSKWKGKAEWREREKGAWEKAHLIEKNQYGRGKLGAVMRNIDTTSRICHLIGTLAGIVALICGIVGFFQPAALPVGAIATVIALAAHGVMAILQSILVGHNLIRIKGMPPEERAKVMPAIYRDLAKLGFALLGVGLGGMGVGMSVAHGGLMAANMLEGAEQTSKIGELVGENVGEGVGATGMFWGIGAANEQEIALGMKGALGQPGHHGDEEEPTPPVTRPRSSSIRGSVPMPRGTAPSEDQNLKELGEFRKALKNDADDGKLHVSSAKESSLDASGGVDGLAQDARQLDKLGSTDANIKQAQETTEQIASANESDTGERLKDEDQVKEKTKELKKVDQQSDESDEGVSELDQSESTSKSKGGSKKNTLRTKREAGTLQREPSKFQRFKNWLKRKFSGIKKRVARAIAKLRAKLTQIALHIAGVKKFQADLDEALAEKRGEATQVMTAVNESQQASDQYSSSADQFAQQVAGVREKAGKH